jgi:hypothetical protein
VACKGSSSAKVDLKVGETFFSHAQCAVEGIVVKKGCLSELCVVGDI